jgi:hypothetical protein
MGKNCKGKYKGGTSLGCACMTCLGGVIIAVCLLTFSIPYVLGLLALALLAGAILNALDV